MPKKISSYVASDVFSAGFASGTVPLMVEGTFISLNTSGDLILADSTHPARGALLQSAQLKDPKGNVVDTIPRGSFTRVGKMGGCSGLAPGSTYFATSGGQFATSGGTQQVGYAESATVLVIALGP